MTPLSLSRLCGVSEHKPVLVVRSQPSQPLYHQDPLHYMLCFLLFKIGYPNVGKSSTINAILKMKKVPVSATPGRTKHFQVRLDLISFEKKIQVRLDLVS